MAGPASARFNFDGNAFDSSGNHQNAMRVAANRFVGGRVGLGLKFDGENDHLLLPPDVSNADDFTFAVWVNWQGGDAWQRIILN